jgi:hypothetical protein
VTIDSDVCIQPTLPRAEGGGGDRGVSAEGS